MKKTLLASAITLTFLGFATNPALAEENNLQTTTVETTQETTRADKVETKEPSTKETAPSTEASSSLPTTSTTAPSTSPAKKEESKAPEVKKEGWVLEENIWRFYEANKPALNWKKIHGKWYYFDKNGTMLDNTIFDGYI
ncbi:MAG: N-acetylmuramoyl-L-alanine amidase, partial [Streptococcus sp.]